MEDIEKVMSWLEGLSQDDWRDFHSDSEVQNIAKVALELLKEQESTINELQNAYGYLQKQYFEAQDKLLKEQESEKKRIMKVIWDTLHEGLSIDTVADQDWVYEQIRHKIEDI